MPWVYILRCADGSYYVGSTTHLEFRLWQHQNGQGAEYTKRRLPVELAFAHETETAGEAFGLEKRIQGWGRAKREALIRGEFAALPGLASRARARATRVIEERPDSRAGDGGFETRRAAPGAPQPPGF